ncbi:hypothetical protein ES708_01623 [subsurface metagenome]
MSKDRNDYKDEILQNLRTIQLYLNNCEQYFEENCKEGIFSNLTLIRGKIKLIERILNE